MARTVLVVAGLTMSLMILLCMGRREGVFHTCSEHAVSMSLKALDCTVAVVDSGEGVGAGDVLCVLWVAFAMMVVLGGFMVQWEGWSERGVFLQ